jgi:hypothetical protein
VACGSRGPGPASGCCAPPGCHRGSYGEARHPGSASSTRCRSDRPSRSSFDTTRGAGPELIKELLEGWAVGAGAAGGLGEHPLAAGPLEGVDLEVRLLSAVETRAEPRRCPMPLTVSQPHDTAGCATLISDTGCGRPPDRLWWGRGCWRRNPRGLNGWLHRFRTDGESAVEVVGGVLGTVASRAGRAVGAVATRRVAAADRPPDGKARPLDTGLCVADRWRAAAATAAGGPLADGGRARRD